MLGPSFLRVLALTAITIIPVTPCLGQSAFSTYGQSYRTFSSPPVGQGSFLVVGTALTDGRLLAVTGRSIFVESAVGSGVFERVADFDPASLSGTDPGFVTISPDGSTIAVGGGFGRPVAVFSSASLGTAATPSVLNAGNTRFYNVDHFDGRFATNTQLALTAGPFGAPTSVTLLDVTSPTAAPANPTIISNIGGASAGIAFDASGRLFAGNGFDFGPGGSNTGSIRAFSFSEWNAAAAGGTALDFETMGTLIGEVLSAGTLSFDAFGNLFIGGGDFGASFDAGYFGVLSAQAIAAALAGGGPVDVSQLSNLARLDPAGTGFAYYAGFFNSLIGELIIIDGTTWHATVPGAWTIAPLGAIALLAGGRRRA